jgi:hypothetical protein
VINLVIWQNAVCHFDASTLCLNVKFKMPFFIYLHLVYCHVVTYGPAADLNVFVVVFGRVGVVISFMLLVLVNKKKG